MAELYKLENEIKKYAWGSPDMIPHLMGKTNPKRESWAELWMGIHPGGPSKTTIQGKTVLLSEITTLPFLFKFLAAESPLSIQAHPNTAQAKEGFERENKAEIPLSAAERNYRDPNHKPEIICALSPFTAMAGFREKAETAELLSKVNGTENLRSALKEGYLSFLSALFGLSETERKILNESVLKAADREMSAMDDPSHDKESLPVFFCGKLARLYPNDPGILSPLYLNVINLKPFQALFLPAGILHAYIHGLAMECMANSDNVLRGGLTPKHIDLKELFSILNFDPFIPELLDPVRTASPGCYSFAQACREFSLYLIQNPVSFDDPALPEGIELQLEQPEMGIFAVYNGTAEIFIKGKTIVLNSGESAFISRRNKGENIHFSGNFTLFAALAPE